MSTQRLRPVEQYFPTEAWLEAYRDAINADDDFDDSSEGWGVDFDGSFVFQIENVPLETTTVAELPPEIVAAVEDELSDCSEDQLETILADAPPVVRETIESRHGSLEERLVAEIRETTIATLPDRLWPELRAALPTLLADLTARLEENVADDGTVYAYLDLYDSECRGVETVSTLDGQEYGFRLTGDYEQWTTLVCGDGDVIDMLMAGDFEIEGDMQKILQYSDAAVKLGEISAEVDSRFIF